MIIISFSLILHRNTKYYFYLIYINYLRLIIYHEFINENRPIDLCEVKYNFKYVRKHLRHRILNVRIRVHIRIFLTSFI